MEDLILRSLAGRATSAEEASLAAWRRAASENERAYQELAALWSMTDGLSPVKAAPAPTIDDLLAAAGSRQVSRPWLLELVAELKRRRVFRVAAAYAVAVWVVIQVASDAAPALGAPDWVVSTVVLLGVLGFPVAVALAWAFDVSGTRIVRTRSSTVLIPSLAGRIAVAASVVILALAGVAFLAGGPDGSRAAVGDAESRTIVVLPFSVRAAEDLAYLGDGMVEVLATELGGAGSLSAVDPNRVISEIGRSGAVFDPGQGRDIAAGLGAALYVLGTVLEAGGRVRLTASVYDRSRGPLPVATSSVDGPLSELLPLSQRLAQELTALVSELTEKAPVGVHLVWSGDDVDPLGSPSPDARLLSFTDWGGGGNLAVRELATGETRRLTQKPDLSVDDQFAEFSRFSPDGRHVAYGWFRNDYAYELRVSALADSSVRVVLGPHGWVAPVTWRSDGRAVLTAVADGERGALVWAPVAGGAVDTVMADVGEDVSFWGMSLSPDQRWLAHGVAARDSAAQTDIAALALNGGGSAVLVAGPGNDMPLGWLPDGRGLLFWSDRGGVPSVWVQRTEDGRARGAPRLVRADVAWPVALGFAGSDFYYGVAASERQVYEATLDIAAGDVLEPPAPAAHGSAGSTVAPAWSPDGKRLAYIVERLRFGLGATRLAVRDLTTGAVREYPLGLAFPRNVEWLPDGSGVLLMGSPASGDGAELHRLDFASGRLEHLPIGDPDGFKGQFELSPDGRTLWLVESNRRGNDVRMLRHERDTGRDVVVSTTPAASNIIGSRPVALSRDGATLAYVVQHRARGRNELYVAPAAGGAPRLVHSTPLQARISSLQWSADGAHLLFTSDDALWSLRLADGEARPLLRMRGIAWLQLHPDGRRIAFVAGRKNAEIWRLENPGSVLDAR